MLGPGFPEAVGRGGRGGTSLSLWEGRCQSLMAKWKARAGLPLCFVCVWCVCVCARGCW